MHSSPPARAPKLQLTAEQLMRRGCWNIPKKKKNNTPHPKTKKKTKQDSRRSIVTMKSNLIPIGWVTHKLENSKTKEVLPLLWRF